MVEDINAEIIAIGTEILLGEITDTNSVYLARALRDLGINIYFMTTVGDNKLRISQAIQLGLKRANIVIACGGLGPTVDDMTREGIALATNRDLVLQPDLLESIQSRFRTFSVKMTGNNQRQAYLPEKAIPITNPVGTAPGFIVEHENGIVISLPGVPREMKFLMEKTVIPYLRSKYTLSVIRTRILKTAGIGESMLDDMLGSQLLNSSNPTIGLAAHHGVIDIRLAAKAETELFAETMLDEMEISVRERVDPYIFGVGDEQIENALAELLISSSVSLSLIECGVDTELAALLSSQDIHSRIVIHHQMFMDKAHLIQQYNQLKSAAFSPKEFLTHLAKSLPEANTALIVIISDPDIDEGSDTDEATVVGVTYKDETRMRVYGFGGRSPLVKSWGGRWAMSTLWQMLRAQHDEK